MIVYHEVNSDAVARIMREGLQCTDRGPKGDDVAIKETDDFLDAHCPPSLKEAGVSRNNNVYAFMRDGNAIIRITDGTAVPLDTFVHNSSQSVLQLSVDPHRCYVSDLDVYDRLKDTLAASRHSPNLTTLATTYWGSLTPLVQFTPGDIRRPEIMITYTVPPTAITPLQ